MFQYLRTTTILLALRYSRTTPAIFARRYLRTTTIIFVLLFFVSIAKAQQVAHNSLGGSFPTGSSTAANVSSLPSIVKRAGGGYSFMVDGKPWISLGAQLWNSSGWPYILDKVWPQLAALHANTLEAPVYWQNVEPEEGKFNFKELDELLSGAKKAGLRLVLLWFGSYKNGSSQYAPAWVLEHPEKYPRMHKAGGETLQILSAVSPVNMAADRAAFTALLTHLRQVDGQDHAVILIQVENESGSYGADRDYSPAATEEFNGQVPQELIQKLGKQPGNWEKVFPGDAAEAFSAWCIAHYVNGIAAAGRAVYDLPMYANDWLRENAFQRPGEYPSGGPTSNMLDIWKATAPALDFLSPDIYLGNVGVFREICGKYSRPDNPLFIPEMGKAVEFARFQFYALGDYDALGVAPYGIDPFLTDPSDERGSKDKLDEKFSFFADNYRLLRGALDKIAELQGTGRLKAVGEEAGLNEQLVSLGSYDILFTYGFPAYKKRPLTGRALVGQLGEDEFLILGFDTRFQFRPKRSSGYPTAEIISIEEGSYTDGKWIRKRIWNGDEAYWSTLTQEGNILKIRLQKIK
jgi:hypothetical protein